MSSIRNLKLEVVLAAIDKATRPIKGVINSTVGLSKQLKETKDKLKALNDAQGNITAFRQLTKDAKDALIYSPTAGPKPPDLRTSAH